MIASRSVAVLILALAGAYYVLALKPERQKASALDTARSPPASGARHGARATMPPVAPRRPRSRPARRMGGAAQGGPRHVRHPRVAARPRAQRGCGSRQDAGDHAQRLGRRGGGNVPRRATPGGEHRAARRASRSSSRSPAATRRCTTSSAALTGWSWCHGHTVHATGPLLSISNVSLSGSPKLTVQLTATIYQLSATAAAAIDRRPIMSSLRRDLFERKLWPVVVLLLVAVVAVPLMLRKNATASVTPVPPAPPLAGATAPTERTKAPVSSRTLGSACPATRSPAACRSSTPSRSPRPSRPARPTRRRGTTTSTTRPRW